MAMPFVCRLGVTAARARPHVAQRDREVGLLDVSVAEVHELVVVPLRSLVSACLAAIHRPLSLRAHHFADATGDASGASYSGQSQCGHLDSPPSASVWSTSGCPHELHIVLMCRASSF